MAILGLAVVLAVGLFAAVPREVVDYEQIKPPIVVDVAPCSRHRPKWPVSLIGMRRHACLLGNVRECAIAVIAVKGVSVDSGHKKIVETVVIVVSDGYAHIEACPFEAGFLGYIGKRSVTIIVKEAVPVLRRVLLQRIDVCAIGEKDIGLSIAVIVKDRNSTRNGLRRMALRGLVAVERKRDGTWRKVNRRSGLLLAMPFAGTRKADDQSE